MKEETLTTHGPFSALPQPKIAAACFFFLIIIILLFFNTSLCCYRLEKKPKKTNLTQVWIPPRLSHSLYHTSALLEEKRKAYLVIIFSSFTLYICKKRVCYF